MDEWLVRTAGNWLAGPFTRKQVRDLVLQKKLKADDEICRGNHYWLSLKERKEVLEALGVEPPAEDQNEVPGDRTKTQIEVAGVNVDTSLAPRERQPFWLGAFWFLVISLAVVLLSFLRLWYGISNG